jgi:LysR family hydrogen peroxide-inducible transcriptional activator
MSITLKQLRYLVAIADNLHFGKAAEACFISQPALSTQIQLIEEILGVSLVERNKQHVLITPLGGKIVERARRILGEVDDLAALAQANAPLTSSLCLGVIPTIGPYVLPTILPQLRQAFPRLSLILQEEKTSVLLERLREGKIDLVLLALPVDIGELVSEDIAEEPFVLAMPAKHPLSSQKTVNENALKGQELLLLEDGHCLREHALSVCQQMGAHEQTQVQASSLGTLAQMVANGLGLTLLPATSLNREVQNQTDITVRPFELPIPNRHLGFVWRRTACRVPEFQMLVNFFKPLIQELIQQSRNIAKV